MRKDKEKSIKLRRAGKSYKEIRKKLGIPLATLSGWFKNIPWSYEIKQKLSEKNSFKNNNKTNLAASAIKSKWQRFYEESKQEAVKEFPDLKDDPLFLAGIMLYWGEGDKKLENSIVRLSNSDPFLIRTFYLFLQKIMAVPQNKISASLLLYPDLIENVQKKFWNSSTNIPMSNFKKSTVIQGRRPTRRSSYGVCTIIVCSRKLKEKIMKWIDLYKIDLLK